MRILSSLVLVLTFSLGSAYAGDAERIQEGRTFMKAYEHSTDFETKAAKKLAADLDAIGGKAEDPDTMTYRCTRELKVCNEALLVASAVHGIIANKVKANGGGLNGRISLANIQQVFSTNAMNYEASIAYGMMMSSLATQSKFNRFFIETSMGISIETESKEAMKKMRLYGAEKEPAYAVLKAKYGE